jgi:hypothetical protein
MSLKTISSLVSIEVGINILDAFCHVVPIDLTSIFTGYGLLPAVIGTENQMGNWDTIGQTRTVNLSDGSSAKERLTQYQKSDYFSYVVSDFSGILGLLITSAVREWWFETGDLSPNSTVIRWNYTFIPKSLIAIPILWMINKFLWAGYMRSVISNIQAQLDPQAVKFF